jgi:hypothetical protein
METADWIPKRCKVGINDTADSEAKQAAREGTESRLLRITSDRIQSPMQKKDKRTSQFLSEHQKG